jgi:glycolate oxidase
MISVGVLKKLERIVGCGHVTDCQEDRVCHSYDATAQQFLPDAVAFPATVGHVASILHLANEVPFFVIPRGAGSGLTGGCLPVKGGLVLSMSRFNRIIDIDPSNLVAEVEPGVVTAQFHRAVEKRGLFYPPDPSSAEFSTLGGNLAECAGGPRALKYGVTRDYVLGLEAVLATGEIIRTGVRTAKGVVGYDLTRLLVGSEGTLGVITRMTLKLIPLPETVGTMTAWFPTIQEMARTVSQIIGDGILPRTLEFMDQASIRCVEAYMNMGLPVHAGAMLLIEVDGSSLEVDSALDRIRDICEAMGAARVEKAQSVSEAQRLWKARKAISPALFRLAPHKINEDIVVPRSRIPDMVEKIEGIKTQTGLTVASFGHAGDGNIHFNIMLDKSDARQVRLAETAIDVLFDHTLALGGTISGEHGVGITKAPYVAKEIGPVEIRWMKNIKDLFDPLGILNPGKLFAEP